MLFSLVYILLPGILKVAGLFYVINVCKYVDIEKNSAAWFKTSMRLSLLTKRFSENLTCKKYLMYNEI